MKKILIILSVVLCINTAVYAEKINQVVFLDTTMEEAEEILLDTIQLYEGKVQLTEANKEKHLFTAQYYNFNALGLYNNINDTNININVNSENQINNNKTNNTQYAYGGYSCQLKQLKNNKDILCTCRKFCYAQDYIYSHYKKYYREMKLNGKQVVKLKKYLKGKYTRVINMNSI